MNVEHWLRFAAAGADDSGDDSGDEGERRDGERDDEEEDFEGHDSPVISESGVILFLY